LARSFLHRRSFSSLISCHGKALERKKSKGMGMLLEDVAMRAKRKGVSVVGHDGMT
jgi:hypothetical protein